MASSRVLVGQLMCIHQPCGTDCLQCGGQVLGDLVEALTGAIFLDTGQDLDATWQVRHGYAD